jgi:hypothetical protein
MEEGMSDHPADAGKMACRLTTKWIVNMQHRIQGKWVDPLPGMDRLHATCWTREDARALVKAMSKPMPGQRFVIRKEVET